MAPAGGSTAIPAGPAANGALSRSVGASDDRTRKAALTTSPRTAPQAGGHAPPARVWLPAAAFLGAPLAVGAFVSTGWSWGWDHLHRAPAWWTLALAALLVLLVAPAARARFLALVDRAGLLLARHPRALPAGIALAALALFLARPIATLMYGDSQAILNHHTAGDLALHLRRVFSTDVQMRGAAVSLLHDVCERLTGLPYPTCYRVVSALCGGLFVYAHLRLAATLPGARGWARTAIAWLGLTDGANQLFFGHVENYTVPRLLAALFLISVVRTLTAPRAGGRRWWGPGAALPGAIVLHLQWLVLLPAALLLAMREAGARRPRLAAWAGSRGALLLVALMLAAVAGAYVATGAGCYDYLYTGGRPEPRQILLPLATACAGQPYLNYALFAPAHLLDLAGGLWSLSSPAVLLVIVLFGWRRRREAGLAVLAPAAVAALLHDFVLNPSIGFPFDWDLMSVVSPPLLYLAVWLVAREGGAGKDADPAVDAAASARASAPSAAPAWLAALLLLGLGTATVFAVNAEATAARGRVEDMAVWLHRTYYGNSHYRLSGNLGAIADPARQERERARVLERLRPQTYAEDREVAFLWERLGLLRMELLDNPGALAAYREALRLEPARWSRLKNAGWLETVAGDRARGVAELQEYLGHAPKDAAVWRQLGAVHANAGRREDARQAWRKSLELQPDGPEAERVREDLRRLAGFAAE